MDRLWDKEPESDELYVNIFENISEELRTVNSTLCLAATKKQECVFRPGQKNGGVALLCMEQGEKHMEEGKYLEAMFLYNQSLCFAETGLEAVCYAYRAECFLKLKMYEKCLADIEISKQVNTAEELLPRLNRLRVYCVQQMRIASRFQQLEPKLSYKVHEKFPGMANVLSIEANHEFGRHITANRDIPAGKTILVEEAMLRRSHGTKYSKCTVCLKPTMNFIPCSNCTNVLFCDNTCASDSVHKVECSDNWIETDDEVNEFLMRSIFVAISIFPSIPSLMEFVVNSVNEEMMQVPDSLNDAKEKYRAFLQLNVYLSDEIKNGSFSQAFVAYNHLLLRESIRGSFASEREKRFLMHLVSHHMVVHSSNSYDSMDDRKCTFIISSYFNHSCTPNTLGISTANQRYCITTRPIKAGQQVFVNYIGDLGGVNECKTFLQKTFGFQCACERCEPNVELMNRNSKNMQSDRDYQNWTSDYHRWQIVHFDLERDFDLDRLINLRQKTVDLLNRFGSKHWCDKLEYVTDSYFYLLTAKARQKYRIPWVSILIFFVAIFFVLNYYLYK